MGTALLLGIAGMMTTLVAGIAGQWITAHAAENRERAARLETARREAYLEYIESVGALADPEPGAPDPAAVRRINAASSAVHLLADNPGILDLVPRINQELLELKSPDRLDMMLARFTNLAREDLGLDRYPNTENTPGIAEYDRHTRPKLWANPRRWLRTRRIHRTARPQEGGRPWAIPTRRTDAP